MMRSQWLGVLALLLMVFPVSAQLEWKVVERCFQQTHASEDWSFEGTILLKGYGGIHGVNAQWDTPRVVARAPARPYAAVLSPDGFWYATLEGDTAYSITYNHSFYINAIVVYSTLYNREFYRLGWGNSWLNNWGYRRMYWYDNQQLLYETRGYSMDDPTPMLINPFTGETSEWTGTYDLLQDGGGAWYDWVPLQFPSPDFGLTVVPRHQELVDSQTGVAITGLEPALHSFSPYVEWHPEGMEFVAEIGERWQASLARFNSQGDFVDIIFDLGESSLSDDATIQWSPDGRYIAFATHELDLYIADTSTNQVIDTCLDIGEGFAWSPDGSQLAFIEQGRWRIADVQILDPRTHTARIVARHIVQIGDGVIGWRLEE